MEKILKEIVKTDDFLKDPLENLITSIQTNFTKLIKYKPLFNDGLRDYYEIKLHEIYGLLIRQSKYFLEKYYEERIGNIYSEAEIFLSETVEKTEETVKTVKTTVETVETEEETDEES